jgi:O-antigen polysaccharide polymerase Wzy
MNASFFRQLLGLAPYGYAVLSLCLLYLGVTAQPLPVESTGAACWIGGIYCLMTCGLNLAMVRVPVFSFPGGFLAISGFYMVSLLLVYPIYGDHVFSTWHKVDIEAVLQGIPLIMLAFSCFLLGTAFAGRFRPREDSESGPAPPLLDVSYVRVIGAGMFALAMLIILGYTFGGGGLNYAFEGGYSYLAEKQYQDGGSALLWGALGWFLPWSVIMLSATADSARDLRWLMGAVIPANLILILVGDRGGLLVLDLVLLMRLSLLGIRFKLWQGVMVVSLVILIVPTLRVLRQTASKEWTMSVITEAVLRTSEKTDEMSADPISATLMEGGSMYKVLMGTVALVPSQHGFHYGMDYVNSLAAALPFFTRFLPDAVPQNGEWLKEYLDHRLSVTGLGFLQVAEAYLQFGAWGVAGMYLFLGFLMIRLWRYCGLLSNARHLAYVLVLMSSILLWVRNEFHIVMKPAAWCFILLVILPALLARKGKRPNLDPIPPPSQPEAVHQQ